MKQTAGWRFWPLEIWKWGGSGNRRRWRIEWYCGCLLSVSSVKQPRAPWTSVSSTECYTAVPPLEGSLLDAAAPSGPKCVCLIRSQDWVLLPSHILFPPSLFYSVRKVTHSACGLMCCSSRWGLEDSTSLLWRLNQILSQKPLVQNPTCGCWWKCCISHKVGWRNEQCPNNEVEA